MILINERPEPADFDHKVRKLGREFLAKVPNPTEQEFKNKAYWRKAFIDLYNAYHGICVYSSSWVPGSGATVDHFLPKARVCSLAYEWSNFRLASMKLNSRKQNFLDVIDPFKIGLDWFWLGFPSMLISPNPALNPIQEKRVSETIARLKFNEDEVLINDRLHWVLEYRDTKITIDDLTRKAPFIAHELQRQNLLDKDKLRSVVKTLSKVETR
ncbi:hypothetical protein L0337_11120 [candidate division KSB1 bacterium]|nr:hypothetical protein [candidate division KSB1 bacterium]